MTLKQTLDIFLCTIVAASLGAAVGGILDIVTHLRGMPALGLQILLSCVCGFIAGFTRWDQHDAKRFDDAVRIREELNRLA